MGNHVVSGSERESPTKEDETSMGRNEKTASKSKVASPLVTETCESVANEMKPEESINESVAVSPTNYNELVERIDAKETWKASQKVEFARLVVDESNDDESSSNIAQNDIEGEDSEAEENDSDDNCLEIKRRQAKIYTREEDMILLRHLIDRHLISQVKGRYMWQQLEKGRVLNRTWQSMKERYLKRILPELWKYDITFKEAKEAIIAAGLKARKERELIEDCHVLKKRVPRLLQ
ncbi:hypothetical protein B4U80_12684 [Leptotrombidium deliense]|uniref:Telomeric repeat-binding factor 2-interacting protein 1 n=1 Tax=Leptotrombidium deliense TaxID=299467 RepID=A0A443SWF9_9ACAR|nr:hypothetical protein B4U80_12684 [Leptotrombidium deliense]